ncbi:MAG: DUF4190 domain-containing protein [Kiritimatiellia bacterium]|nr:DUF4190 domain-containing protein [Kiritimatiellia bacterium]
MKTNAPLAIWSLILGILSIFACGPLTGIPAIICGHMARAKIKAEQETLTGDGMALAGLIMGYFSIVVFILLIIVGIVAAIAIPNILPQQPAVTQIGLI